MYMKNEEREDDLLLGTIIKLQRGQKGYSLIQLATMTGISSNYLNRLENNIKKAPPIPVMQKIARALDLSMNELL